MSVSLAKGQKINLQKSGGGTLTEVRMGLGWDAVAKRGLFGGRKSQSIDLDASCLMLDADRHLVDQVWFNQLTSRDGSVQHTGDNRTGDGAGDDESIIVHLDRVPANVVTLVFTVNSFTGQNFSQIENAFCRLVDATAHGQPELARFDLTGSGQHTAQVMCKIYRHQGAWKMAALGQATSGRTFRDLMPAVLAVV